MATDTELVKRVQNGESEAYAELFRKYYQHIYAICISLIKNPQDAEELAQEMFVLAYLKVDQLRDPASFFPWLKRMARNRSRNFIQRRKANVIPLSLVEMKRNSVNPDEEILRQELIQAIMEAIEALPADDRQVVRARIDGLSHAEISRRFGISRRASLSRLYRARKKLASHLKGLYSIFGLAGILRLKKIMSGGIVVMKIGTGAKVTIGVISVLAVGFIGFQIATRQPEQEISPPDQAIQEVSAQSLKTPKTSQQTPDEKEIQTQVDSITTLSDSSEESVTEKEAEDFLAILDQMDNQENFESSEETVDPEEEAAKAHRERVEKIRQVVGDAARTQIPVLVEQWKENKAIRHELGARSNRSRAENQELTRLQLERGQIEGQLSYLAGNYGAVFREEGAQYPDGWIGKYLKQVGIVIRPGAPVYPPDL